MADSDFSLLSLLKAQYPSVPSTVVLRVMNRYDNKEEMCKQALDSEVERFNNSDNESFQAVSTSRNTNSNNNLESPGEGKSITTRIKELQKSHEGSPQPKSFNQERHVTTIERSIGNVPRPTDQSKRPYIGQSVSWTVQPPDRQTAVPPQPTNWTPNSSMTTPQTAPPDFTPFFIHSAKDIPNINCSTSGFGPGTAGPTHYGTRPHQISVNSSSATSSPVEQRRPVKVINIPPGSLSGGSVSPAATTPNPRHIHMHFGDTGGICTISAPPSTLQHYGSTPNVNQQYRSEIRTEAPAAHSLHSSSIVVNTSNHLTPDRKLSISNSGSDSSLSGRRTPNPPVPFKPSDLVPNTALGSMFSPGKLSMPVQATSPGISHSKPVFVEIKTDRMPGNQMHGGYDSSYPAGIYPGGSVKPPPSNVGFMPHHSGAHGSQSNLNYNFQYNTDFPTTPGFPQTHSQQEHMYPQNPLPKKHPGYNSPPSNLYQPATSTGYSPSSHSQLNPANLYPTPTSSGYIASSHSQLNPNTNMVYPSISIPGHHSSQTPGHIFHYTQYSPHAGHSPGIHIPKSPSSGIGQMLPGSRSNSQDSEPYNAMGSRVSSHSSLSSDSSSSHLERIDSSGRPRSGSIQDDAEYIHTLVQHQQSQVQKLLDEMNNHKAIFENLHSEVSLMEMNMIEASHVSRSFPSIEDISRLCESNRQLQTDIQLYMNEIDMYKSGQTPFNKINPRDQQNFFDNMPTGQQDPIYSRTSDERSTSPRLIPPPRPPPPIPARQRSTDPMQAGAAVSPGDIFCVPPVPPTQPMVNSGESEEGESWSCSACTFFNHPALKKCEMCEMSRVMANQSVSSLAPPIASTHQSMSSLAPRLPPGLVGGAHHRSASPHSALGHHHHHSGT